MLCLRHNLIFCNYFSYRYFVPDGAIIFPTDMLCLRHNLIFFDIISINLSCLRHYYIFLYYFLPIFYAYGKLQ